MKVPTAREEPLYNLREEEKRLFFHFEHHLGFKKEYINSFLTTPPVVFSKRRKENFTTVKNFLSSPGKEEHTHTNHTKREKERESFP